MDAKVLKSIKKYYCTRAAPSRIERDSHAFFSLSCIPPALRNCHVFLKIIKQSRIITHFFVVTIKISNCPSWTSELLSVNGLLLLPSALKWKISGLRPAGSFSGNSPLRFVPPPSPPVLADKKLKMSFVFFVMFLALRNIPYGSSLASFASFPGWHGK